MYPEFIAIYVALGVLFVMLAAVIVMLIMLLKKGNDVYIPRNNTYNPSIQTAAAATGNLVFCKRCAAEFDASQRVCPKCGTPR